MLNKELLLASENEPHMLLILNSGQGFVDPGDSSYYGYLRSYPEAMGPSIGNVNRIPYWDSPDSSYLQGLYARYNDHGGYSTGLRFRYMIPSAPMYVTIKNLTAEFATAYTTWLYGPHTDVFDLERSEGMTLPVYFDPPPRRLSGSRDTQTDLRRGYYVEEVPWEAQNAEQGTSDDRRRRGVVDSAVCVHWGFLYKTEIAGFRRAPSLGRISANRYLNVSRTSGSNEVALSLLFCWGTQIHKRRWVYSRLLQQARDRNFSASKRGVSRNKLRSVTFKEALYA